MSKKKKQKNGKLLLEKAKKQKKGSNGPVTVEKYQYQYYWLPMAKMVIENCEILAAADSGDASDVNGEIVYKLCLDQGYRERFITELLNRIIRKSLGVPPNLKAAVEFFHHYWDKKMFSSDKSGIKECIAGQEYWSVNCFKYVRGEK